MAGERYIGEFCSTRTAEWESKKGLYKSSGLWEYFTSRRAHYREVFRDPVTGISNTELAHKAAQAEADGLWKRKERGEAVVVLEGDGKEEAGDSNPGVAERACFSSADVGKVDVPSDILWVYYHLGVADVKPEDAPNPGAWALLQHVQHDSDRIGEFYKGLFAKIVPSRSQIESMEKFRDDGREQFELLDRLAGEDSGPSSGGGV